MSVNNQKTMFNGYTVQLIATISDMLCLIATSFLWHWVLVGEVNMHDRYIIATAVISIAVVLVNFGSDAYSHLSTTSFTQMFWNLTIAWFVVGAITGTIIYFLEASEFFSRPWLALTFISSFLLVCFSRLAVKGFIWWLRSKGRHSRNVFLIGPSSVILSVGYRMRAFKSEGFSIAGICRMNIEFENEAELNKLCNRIKQSGAAEIWICLPLEMGPLVKKLMYAFRNETAEIRFLPDFSDAKLLNHRVSEVVGRYAIDLSVTPMSGSSRIFKRFEDIILGSIIFILIIPICLCIALAIKLNSPGPVLFKQYRTGANGRKFKVYKFRSMSNHIEKSGEVVQAVKGDARITSVGSFLRRTSLDELPQFFNVIQGRMSIVGPRPHALAHNDYYKDLVESYMKRHMVKPGITGWAQVNGFRGETDTLEKMKSRVDYDLWYIDNWSVFLDLKIITMTFFHGFINKNAY